MLGLDLLARSVCRRFAPTRVWPRVAANTAVCHQRVCSTATDPLPKPPADGSPRVYPEKVRGLVNEISGLTLTEVAQLNDLLKVRRLNKIPTGSSQA